MQAIDCQSIPQAIILEGPEDRTIGQLQQWFAQWICACGHCQNCQLLLKQAHPDVYWLKPQASGHAIKVEQVREVLLEVMQTPCLLPFQLVVIESADTMNAFAANALLKSLEEPSSKLHFILLVKNAKQLPITLRSRCWYWPFSTDRTDQITADLLPNFLTLQQDVLAYLQGQLDLFGFIQKYETFGVEHLCQSLQWLTQDILKQRLTGNSQLNYDIVFQVSLPLSIWWAFWEKLLYYRSVYRNQTSLNSSLLLSDLLLILQGKIA